MQYFKIFLGLGMFLILSLTVFANDIPQLIGFQGILSDVGTGNPVRNATKDVEFKIYDADVAGNIKWSETQTVNTDNNGVFNVLLGAVNAIPDTAFAGFPRWLGIKIVGEASEMTPRQKLASVPYSYEFDNKGPDSINSAMAGPSFLAKNSFSSASDVIGSTGSAQNPGSGQAVGGVFKSSGAGTGNHLGISTLGQGGNASVGIEAAGQNFSSGTAYGGTFVAYGGGGTGVRYGINSITVGDGSTNYANYDSANGSTADPTYGTYSVANNSSSGWVTGGFFGAHASGTGDHAGVVGRAEEGSKTRGVIGVGKNTSTGEAYGGQFEASGIGGTGTHYGIHVYTSSGSSGLNYAIYDSANGSTSDPTYGTYSVARNTSSGDAYGGYFKTTASGSGDHYGVYSIGDNTSPFPAATFGGFFKTTGAGTGQHFGLWSEVSSTTSIITEAIHAKNTSTIGSPIAVYAFAGGVGAVESFGLFSVARDASDHNVGVLGRGIGTDPIAGLFDGGRVRIGVGYTTGEDVVDGTGDLYVADEAEVDGGLAIGQGGAKITKVLTAAASLNFGSISAGGSSELTIAVSGASEGDVVMLGVPYQTAPNGIIYSAWVAFGGGVVTVRAYNYSSVAIDPVSGTFRAAVMKF